MPQSLSPTWTPSNQNLTNLPERSNRWPTAATDLPNDGTKLESVIGNPVYLAYPLLRNCLHWQDLAQTISPSFQIRKPAQNSMTTSNEQFHVAAKVGDVKDGEKILVEVADQLLILFQVGDTYYCLDDICTHDGGTLSDGELEGCEISCPRHGAKFDVRSGAALSMPATQSTGSYEVKVDGDQILVKITD